ncbi:YbgF trimerization domain-containing protein [Cellvibrio sp. QJXJ]|uniref:YbgF trimerization domain-containing protein n=1 Tax=Cellvibrio sp. QJXJ TaxID=2964606 RepID=UPI0021C4C013|nr:YbgF trimerization domain-containing protein [Cellvibrio sp. QJXJ]UUA72697.1 tetratricopeptide repeat protein [Cellvibrio sp. QJXJ]
MLKNLIAVALIASAPVLQAQVRVVESSPQGFGSGVAQPNMPASAESDVYSQIRSLQEEIATLRGLVEEQAYELKQLKQLQLDNYIDLDRRISGGSQSAAPAPSDEPLVSPSASVVDGNASEADVYKAAYDLLNQKDFTGAESAFKDHLTRFPSGDFASNSHYWLGKIAMLKKDYPQAKSWFTDLIANFPSAAKVPDAQLDLGKVYFLMGDKVKAKSLLSQLAAGNTDAARLASKFISDNF